MVMNDKKLNAYEYALRKIAHMYMTPEELRKEDNGLTYEELLEMAYENIILEAKTVLEKWEEQFLEEIENFPWSKYDE